MKKQIKTLIIVAVILLVPYILTAQIQGPGIQWQKTIGGDNDDYLIRIIQTSDGGYILQGSSYSVISGDKTVDVEEERDCWLVKLDATGGTVWQKAYEAEFVNEIQQTSDGGYILGLTSFTYGYPGLNDYYLIKTDDKGNIQWQDTIGGTAYEEITAIIETPDKGYLIGGSSESDKSSDRIEPSRGSWDIWLVKIDSMRSIKWQKTYGGDGRDFLSSMYSTADGGFILGSTSNSGISGEKTEVSDYYGDYWILKIDSIGNIIRQETIKASYADYLSEAIPTKDGGYFLAGYSYSDISEDKTEPLIPNSLGNIYREVDYWVLKLDSLMQIKWQKVYGGGDVDQLEAACLANDNGYLLTGWSDSPIEASKTIDNHEETSDVWLVRIDSLGNILWQKVIGTNESELIYTTSPTKDNGFIIGVWTAGGISFEKTEECKGQNDYWIIKLEPEDLSIINNVVINCPGDLSQLPEIYPNPADDYIYLKSFDDEDFDISWQIFDLTGKKIDSGRGNENQPGIYVGHLSPSVYYLQVTFIESKTTKTFKLMKR